MILDEYVYLVFSKNGGYCGLSDPVKVCNGAVFILPCICKMAFVFFFRRIEQNEDYFVLCHKQNDLSDSHNDINAAVDSFWGWVRSDSVSFDSRPTQ
jgi:hypothetical protein